MNKIDDIQLKSILPTSIADDENVQAICETLDKHLKEITDATLLVLLLPRLDALPEHIVDELAWQFHVDFYDTAYDISIKRDLVRQAIAQHRVKGTRAVIEDVATTVLGKNAEVKEWFDYDGRPYYFKIAASSNGFPKQGIIDKTISMVNNMKNVRSWLDSLAFVTEQSMEIFLTGASQIARMITMNPEIDYHVPEIDAKSGYGGGFVSISRKSGNVISIGKTLYIAMANSIVREITINQEVQDE